MSGVTTETVKSMIIDAGAVFADYGETNERILGATREGASFLIEQEVREIPIDGVRGPLKGGRRVISEHARITANLLEMTPDNLSLALLGSSVDSTTEPDTSIITRENVFPKASEYLKNVALVGRRQDTGQDVIFIIKNPLADGNFELETTDDDEASLEVQFTAHFDPADVTISPWEIRVPTPATGG